ncbi:MAG: WYL domain-containing protein [Caldilinea sp. CFX5]|nr:WYL domain-containing protein [Caldilinea sp. CFX5]
MPMLPDLHTCLRQTPWRQLLGIMAANGLSASTRWPKADLVAALQAHLQQPTWLTTIIPAFPAAVQQALQALLQAGGQLPAAGFQERYGALQPYRPWRTAAAAAGPRTPHAPDEEPALPPPWQAPATPAAALWWRGLIYLHPPKADPRIPQQITLPAELLPPLQQLLAQDPIILSSSHLVTLSSARPGQPPDLCWHLALWLATLAAAPVRTLRGGWLPPNTLHALAQRVGLVEADAPFSGRKAAHRPRSERAFPYLAFLHYLACAADFVNRVPPQGGLLALTPLAWRWLAAEHSAQWQQLWAAWRQPVVAVAGPLASLWPSFTPNRQELLLAQLRRLPTDHYIPLADLVEQVHLHDRYQHFGPPPGVAAPSLVTTPAAASSGVFTLPTTFADSDAGDPAADLAPPLPAADPHSDQGDLFDDFRDPDSAELPVDPLADNPVAALCTAPLFWLGLVDCATSTPQPASLASATPLLRLTPLGAWLLGLVGWAAPAFAARPLCTLAGQTPDLILAPPHVAPVHLARLAPLCLWQPPIDASSAQRLQLTAERVGEAVAAGLAPAQLLQILADALGRAPSRRQQQRLRAWATAGQQVRLQPMLVLETADAPLMGRLRSRALVRNRLSIPLSPTRSAVQPAQVAALVQTLRTLGLYVQIPPAYERAQERIADKGAEDRRSEAREGHDGGASLTNAAVDSLSSVSLSSDSLSSLPSLPSLPHSGFLWLLLQLYQGLSAYVPLPMHLPPGLREAIGVQLTLAQQSAAEAAVRQLLAALDQSLRGYHALPNPVAPPQTVEPLPLIKAALAQQTDLTIRYSGGGRNDESTRRITPYYLETRNQIAYLIAWCHLRQAERVFRVDRITAAEVVTG